jgi:hypothetical protein
MTVKNEDRRTVETDDTGAFGQPLVEVVPQRNNLTTEKVISGQNNSFIVLGRDRVSSPLGNNYCAKGTPGSGMIDLVAGMSSQDPQEAISTPEGIEDVLTNPDAFQDASRVYIAQRTDCDTTFGVADGQYGNAVNGSAVVTKADHVRIIGRKSIKIVTRTDPTASTSKKEKQADGTIKATPEDIKATWGIDLIAGNDDEGLQAMVKGENLVEFLIEVLNKVDNLTGILTTFIQLQMQYNRAIAQHTHITPFFGKPTEISFPLQRSFNSMSLKVNKDVTKSNMGQKYNLRTAQVKYLTPAGSGWILSRYNKTN